MTDAVALKIVMDLAQQNLLDKKDCDGDDGMLGMRKDQLKALEQAEAFIAKHTSKKAEKPAPFFLTPTMEAVLNVLLADPRASYAKHDIAKRCKPVMNDHAVSARISDLRKRGFDIQKTKAHGKPYYLYFIPRS